MNNMTTHHQARMKMTPTTHCQDRADTPRACWPRHWLRCSRPRPRMRRTGRPETVDKVADVLTWVVIVIVPIVGITVFWLVHILPEKIAHKRHHPQTEAIQVLCLLSLVFGGLLWPLAWLWAYSKPVLYKMAYGTDKAEGYAAQRAEAWMTQRATCARTSYACERTSSASCRRKGRPGNWPKSVTGWRRSNRASGPRGGGTLMEVLLLGIYGAFVWLIFIKFKWLPWNTTSQVTVAIIPIVALTVLILCLNVVAPSSADVRVFKYTIPIVSQVRGRVIEVPVEEGNRLVKKGDVLFRVDPTPYQLTVDSLAGATGRRKGRRRAVARAVAGGGRQHGRDPLADQAYADARAAEP